MGILNLLSNAVGPQSILSYHRTYNWDLFMFFSMGYIRGELLSKFCQEIKFGDYSISEMSRLRWGGKLQFFPGVMEIENITATFVVPFPDLVGPFFRAWRRKVIDDQGFYGVKTDYAKSIHVWISNTTYFPAIRLVLKNVFPISVPSFDLSYNNEDVLKYAVTLSVEKVEVGGVIGESGSFVESLLKF